MRNKIVLKNGKIENNDNDKILKVKNGKIENKGRTLSINGVFSLRPPQKPPIKKVKK